MSFMNSDSGAFKFDQSLATQMLDLDYLDEFKTLKRGLFSELNISEYRSIRINRDIRIVKTYREHPGILNRELTSIFLVEIGSGEPVTAATSKTERLFWMPWHLFLRFFAARMKDFTKTAQFYFSEPALLRQIERESIELLSLSSPYAPESQVQVGHPPLVRVDRWPGIPKTYYGKISSALLEAGELY